MSQEATRRSHWDALTRIEESGAPYGLVMEDDATWLESLDTVKRTLQHVAADIERHPVILLSCNPDGSVMESDKPWLSSVIQCHGATAYIIRRDYIPTLKKAWGQPVEEYWGAIDQTWKDLQIQDNWAVTNPKLTRQRVSYSDNEHKVMDWGGQLVNRTRRHNATNSKWNVSRIQ